MQYQNALMRMNMTLAKHEGTSVWDTSIMPAVEELIINASFVNLTSASAMELGSASHITTTRRNIGRRMKDGEINVKRIY